MKGYGQFCPVALASEVFAERWTPLIIRELLAGSKRFADIYRGVPRISRNLLCLRLDALERSGIITRTIEANGRGGEYSLTTAGQEFRAVIEALGMWGYKWSTHDLQDENLDPDHLMWVLRRLMRIENLPSRRVVLYFQFTEHKKRRYWLVLNGPDIDVCLFDPGYEVDVEIVAETRAMAEICLGHISLREAAGTGRLKITGPRQLCREMSGWFGVTHFAEAA